MLYVLIYILVTSLYLSNDRQDVYWVDMDDIYGFVALCITCMNGKGHSCQEEELDDGFPTSYGFMLVCIHGGES